MAKRILIPDGTGGVQKQAKSTYKPKPKPWVEGPVSRSVRLERERVFWKLYPEQRPMIEDYVNGMKSEWAKQDARN
jgi:hypothetical protein